jgi:mannitol 2-dehydrogenase
MRALDAVVVEDSFASGRPPLEDAGVQLVDDVAPYELTKLRLLNAGHRVLAQPGRLAGFGYVHEACDPLFRRLLEGCLDEEAAPTLAPVPGSALAACGTGLFERFSSPATADGGGRPGRPIGLTDSRAGVLTARARSADPLAFVSDRQLFGGPVDDERFTAAYRETLASLRTRGVRAALEHLA